MIYWNMKTNTEMLYIKKELFVKIEWAWKLIFGTITFILQHSLQEVIFSNNSPGFLKYIQNSYVFAFCCTLCETIPLCSDEALVNWRV